MLTSKIRKSAFAAVTLTAILTGCGGGNIWEQKNAEPAAPAVVPAVRLNYRFEADVPPPAADPAKAAAEERNAAVQADFDASRPLELLHSTLMSPDKKRIAVVYHRLSDVPSEYRLDMYSADGKPLRKMTSDAMAVHFPETIVWSPDSSTLAFVAMLRVNAPPDPAAGGAAPLPTATETPADNANAEPAATVEEAETPAAPTPAAPTGILTFRTEQIYTSNADGANVKALTLNEGLIYFYYAWSPDSSMLAALATTAREWKYLDVLTNSKGEAMVPQGRPRIIEKNGRERRLDDNQTSVRPVWSPDSSKVAAAFETQVRIYDAGGTNPTQAAIPLRNQLLLSSQAYDRAQQQAGQTMDANGEPLPASTPLPAEPSTLPDEKLLVSYNPIIELAWPEQGLIYLQTAYLKRMRNEADSVRSFSRWHRLPLTAQAQVPVR